MVYYYDAQGRETENCVIDAGMQQNRTITVYGDDGYAIRRILYGADLNDVISTSEIETLPGAPELWTDFAQAESTTVILAQAPAAGGQADDAAQPAEHAQQPDPAAQPAS